jgi:light-independent protochlorophyllide reductase subunit B
VKLQLATYEGPAFWGVSRIAASLKNARIVVYGALGDAYIATLLPSGERSLYPNLICSSVRSQEISMGASSRLSETISQIQQIYPEGVTIIAKTPASDLLKEDIEPIIKALDNPDSPGRVLVAPIEPFRDTEYSAMDKTMLYLIKEFSRSQPRSGEPSVNIIGSASMGFDVRQDLEEVKQILGELEIGINLIAPLGSSAADLKELNRAWFNICLCPEASFLSLKFLEERYGQPYILFPPIGLKGTRDFIEYIGRQVKRDYSSYISRKQRETSLVWFDQFVEPSLKASKTVLLFGDLTHTVGLCKAVKEELGIRVVMAGTYITNWREGFENELKRCAEEILVTDDSGKVAKAIARLKPGMVMATLNEQRLAATLELPYLDISCPTRYPGSAPLISAYSSFLGYRGFDNLINNISRDLSLGGDMDLWEMATTKAKELNWTKDAGEKLAKAPFVLQKKICGYIEEFASNKKCPEVNCDIFDQAREHLIKKGGDGASSNGK